MYPRKKWNTATISRYADAMDAGDEFPPIVIEVDTNRLLDGKHRYEAHKLHAQKCGVDGPVVPCNSVTVPKGMSVKYFAATLSAKHGDRMSNADLKELARHAFDPAENEEVEGWEMPDAQKWGLPLGVSKTTIYDWVAHLITKQRADRRTKAWRLSQLGWTQKEIGEKLGEKNRTTVGRDVQNSETGKMHISLGEHWNAESVAELSNRMQIPLTDAMAGAMDGMGDKDRLDLLDINIRPYDVWNFPGCHDLMGDCHPGRIPGELICHVLWLLTKQGDRVLDPMAGSGTTLDACLLMGRKCRGYDIDGRHKRVDVESHDLKDGWPDKLSSTNLVFWDPPYFSKMDSLEIGEDGYIDGSISKMAPDEYKQFFADSFKSLAATAKPGTKLAFLMSDWDSENAKQHAGHPGIWLWDYVAMMVGAGLKMKRHIQVPLSTQQVHPDIVNKFRESRRLARLERYLLVAEVV